MRYKHYIDTLTSLFVVVLAHGSRGPRRLHTILDALAEQ